MQSDLLFVTACALINEKREVLIAQRPAHKSYGLQWEFPGGKREKGETAEESLCRELYEELNIQIAPKDLIQIAFSSYNYPDFYLFMPLYACSRYSGNIVNKEHADLKWVAASELHDYKFLEADISLLPPLINYIKAMPT